MISWGIALRGTFIDVRTECDLRMDLDQVQGLKNFIALRSEFPYGEKSDDSLQGFL
jgi:hypothetical protein